MGKRPLFLLCNDDGVHAPGIKALKEAAESLGDCVIVAPHEEKSGYSQALTLTSPLRIDPIGDAIYGVTGTPADCVILAFNKILDRRPDFVLSGINRGSNVGQDTLYSGTVAAAMEAVMQGAPGIAFSLDKRRAFSLSDYCDAVKVVRSILEELLENSLFLQTVKKNPLDPEGPPTNPHGVLNVNIPDLDLERMKGFKWSTLGRRIYDKQVVEQLDPRGRPYYWIGGGGEDIEEIHGSDCQFLRDGFVTLSMLEPDHLWRHAQNQLGPLSTNLELRAKKRL